MGAGMITGLGFVTLLVRDYDEAIRFFIDILGLELRADRPQGPDSRWVNVGVRGQPDVSLVLHRPGGLPEHGPGADQIGEQPGFVWFTTDCREEFQRLRALGVVFHREPAEVPWGVQAVFADLYGNSHILVQPAVTH